jgi:hypothetical protein
MIPGGCRMLGPERSGRLGKGNGGKYGMLVTEPERIGTGVLW